MKNVAHGVCRCDSTLRILPRRSDRLQFSLTASSWVRVAWQTNGMMHAHHAPELTPFARLGLARPARAGGVRSLPLDVGQETDELFGTLRVATRGILTRHKPGALPTITYFHGGVDRPLGGCFRRRTSGGVRP
jgi:hypothetical protein